MGRDKGSVGRNADLKWKLKISNTVVGATLSEGSSRDHNKFQGRYHGVHWVDTSTPLFSKGVYGIESLWSVLISFRLYLQTLPRLGRGHPPRTPPILSTPLCLTWRRP